MSVTPHDPPHISVSQINTYSGSFGCPARYYYRYVKRLDSRWVGSSLTIGAGVGRAVQTALPPNCANGLPLWVAEWEDYAHKMWDRISPDVDREAMVSKGGEMLRALHEAGITRFQGVPEYEIRDAVITCPDTNEEMPPLVGYLDWYDPLCHRLIEFKTSASIKQWTAHLLQLTVYRWAAKREDTDSHGTTLTPPQIRLVQVNRAKTPRVKVEDVVLTDKHEQLVFRAIAQTVRAIRAGHFPRRFSYACNGCEYRGACHNNDYSELVERY